MRGPRGTGFLYVKTSVLKNLTPLTLDLHSAEWVEKDAFKQRDDARKYETWETNLASKLGLATAVKEINELGIHNIWLRVQNLADYLREEVAKIDHITIRDYGRQQSGMLL